MAQPRRRQTGSLTAVEAVEQRLLLSAVTVDTALDVVSDTDNLTSLREAITLTNTNASSEVDTISFDAALTSAGPATIELGGTELAITGNVTITGSGAELLTIDANNLSRIFNINDGNNASQSSVEISGLTLTGGNVSGTGGAIYTRENLTVSNSTISGNEAAKFGGGINSYYSTLTVSNSTISGNEASEGGGGINSYYSTLMVSNSTISGNTAYYGGGGINSYYSTLMVSNSTISGNEASVGGQGGGIYNNSYGTLTVSNSTISENTADDDDGGGISNSGTATVSNSTISGNTGFSGGGISNFGTLTVSNSTISGNEADYRGGGIFNSGTLTLSNSIVAGNTLLVSADGATVGGANDIEGTVTGSFNLIGDAATAGGLIDDTDGNIVGIDWTKVLETTIDASQNTVPNLADNGGPTQTIALLPDSPAAINAAINAGNDALLPTGTDYDQRGAPFARIVGDGVDIGAFENENTAPVANDQPVAGMVSVSATEDGPAVDGSFSVTDVDTSDTHTFAITTTPTEGTVTNNSNGTFTFDPGANFQDLGAGQTRNVTFDYTATDNSGAANATSAPATVTVNVTGTGDRQNLLVDTDSDDVDGDYSAGNLSLREAIQLTNANPGFSHTINFGDGLADGGTDFLNATADTITLEGGELAITGDVTITGSGADLLTIDANNLSRIFNINDGNNASQSSVEISGLTLTGGSANGSAPSKWGGAIYTIEELTVSNSTISGNMAGFGGAIFVNFAGTTTVGNSTISGNDATYGGGIFNNNQGTLTVNNSTISGNTAARSGGGINNGKYGTTTVSNSTITGNTARKIAEGGGIFNHGNNVNTTVTISNSIVAGNTFNSGASDIGGAVTGSFNLIGDAATAGGLIDDTDGNIVGVDWKTVLVNNGTIPTLTDNGGPTLTIALANGSRALNNGSNELATDDGTVSGTPLVNDQRGAPYDRKVGIVDIGAFEIQNTAPVADGFSIGGDEDTNISGQLTATDAEPDHLTFGRATSPTNGSVVVQPNGIFIYTPNANFNGSDSFTFTVSDGSLSDTGTINITVAPVNDPGTFTGDTSATTDEDTPTNGQLTFTDTADGDTFPNFRIEPGDEPANGTANIDGPTGLWSYSPADDFNGSDTFTVSVTDDDGNVETQVINITVAPVNDPGTFTGDTSATTDEDTPTNGQLTFTDTADGDTFPNFRIEPGDEPANGTANIDGPTGLWSYSPADDFNGSDTFTVSVTDDDGNVETQVINITVAPVNDPGTFTGDTSATTDEDTPTNGQLTFTDTADGDTFPNFRIEPGDEPANGTANIDGPTGLWSYSPADDFNGSDTFTVSVTDDDGNVETQVINITVAPVNDPGTFTGDTSATTDEDTPTNGQLTFTDTADGDTFPNFRIEPGDEPANGTANIDGPTGLWSYSPADDFNGSDTFTVSVTDDDGNVETQVITITVNAVNDRPVANDVAISAIEDGPAVDGNFSVTDVDTGDTHTFALTSQPVEGAAVNNNDGTFTFDPLYDFQDLAKGEPRDVTFQYTATDDSGEDNDTSEPATVTVTVTGVNDAPTIDVTQADGFREQAYAAAQHLQQSGTVSFDDVDATDLVSITAASNNDIVWSGGHIDDDLAQQLLAGFSTAVTNAQAPGSTPWTYDAENVDLRFLDAGETITFSYTVTATDLQGATADTTLEFLITGTTQVQVSVVRGDLVITGEAGSDVITVEARSGFVSVEGGEFTIVTFAPGFNDGAAFNRNARISLGDGANDLTISETSDLPQQLVVNTGSDDDRVTILDTDVQRQLQLNTGFGNDIVTLSSVTAEDARIQLGGDNDRLIVTGASIEERLRVDADAGRTSGDDWIEFTDVEAGELRINLGRGDDQASLTDIQAEEIRVDGGSGEDTIELTEVSAEEARVDAGRGNDTVTVSDAGVEELRVDLGRGNDQATLNEVTAEEVRVDGGRGNDTVTVSDAGVEELRVDLGRGNDQATLNEVTAEEVRVDGGRGQDQLTTSNNDVDKQRVKKVEIR